jgi:hypothetical protein
MKNMKIKGIKKKKKNKSEENRIRNLIGNTHPRELSSTHFYEDIEERNKVVHPSQLQPLVSVRRGIPDCTSFKNTYILNIIIRKTEKTKR